MNPHDTHGLSRRRLLALGGSAFLGSTLIRSPRLHGAEEEGVRQWIAGLTQSDDATGIALPSEENPLALSLAENRFWNQVLMEHAQFFVMLMPTPRLAGPRGEAEKFMATFSDQLDDSRENKLTAESIAKFNQTSADQARRFADWKIRMRDEQAAGRLQSLVWPSFFQAAALEAFRFATRLQNINGGKTALDRNEVVGFWLSDSSDHAMMIEHLLDPEEHRLVHLAKETAKKFSELRAARPEKQGDRDPVMDAARERVALEATVHQGIQDGRIHSIIQPIMADHMHREGLRFIEELKRAR
jgi:hypothetical protein